MKFKLGDLIYWKSIADEMVLAVVIKEDVCSDLGFPGHIFILSSEKECLWHPGSVNKWIPQSAVKIS